LGGVHRRTTDTLDTNSRLPPIPDSPSKRDAKRIAGVSSRPEFYPSLPLREMAATTGVEASARLAAAYRRPVRPDCPAPDPTGHAASTALKGISQHSKKTDALAHFGLRTLGPIAAGAFSTVVRARRMGVTESQGAATAAASTACGDADGGDVDDAPSEEVAVKSFHRPKYQKEPWLRAALKNELEALTLLQPSRHRHVANLLAVHEAPQATHAILEYCSGGSVHRHLRSLRHGHGLPEQHGTALVHQLALALAHLHAHSIAHRDVKPENVLYADASRRCIKLCDFGFAITCGHKKIKTICGSPAYMAPELCTREAYLGPPVDVWALGCFAFEALHGLAAFRAADMATLQLRIKRCDHTPLSKTLSQEVRRNIQQLLTVDIDVRPSAAACVPSWADAVHRAPPSVADAVDRRPALPVQPQW